VQRNLYHDAKNALSRYKFTAIGIEKIKCLSAKIHWQYSCGQAVKLNEKALTFSHFKRLISAPD
jgi:hypothetical protein